MYTASMDDANDARISRKRGRNGQIKVTLEANGQYRAVVRSYLNAATDVRFFERLDEATAFATDNSIVKGWYKLDNHIATNDEVFLVHIPKPSYVYQRFSTKEEAYRVRDAAYAHSVQKASHYLPDERTQPYAGEDAVRLLPACKICQIEDRKKRDKRWVNWYEGSRFISHDVTKMSEEQVAELKEEARKRCNKYADVISIPRSSITAFHVKHYRYVQPHMEYDATPVPVDPYYLGLWLGDGTSRTTSITTIERPIFAHLQEVADSLDLILRVREMKPRKTEIKDYEFDHTLLCAIVGDYKRANTLMLAMRNLNLIQNKHIPDAYLYNSRAVRLALLAGIIDTDGHLAKNSYEVTQKNKVLAMHIVQLAESLGFHTTWRECTKFCMYKGERREGVYVRIHINVSLLTPAIPVRLERKRFDASVTRKWNLPCIDAEGRAVAKDERTTWTAEDDRVLAQEVAKQHGARVDWTHMALPAAHSAGSKRTHFRDLCEKHGLCGVGHVAAATRLLEVAA